ESDVTLPFRFERSNVNENATTSIGAFTQTDRQNISWNPEVFNRASKRETVWRDNYRLRLNVDKIFLIKLFRIDNVAIDVCKKFEFVSTANVVTITRGAVGNDAPAIDFFYLTRLEWFDHSVFSHHTANPFI